MTGTPKPETTITLPDGRVFPVFEGKPLAWSFALYFTPAEKKRGCPKIRAVFLAAKEQRPDLIRTEIELLAGAQGDRLFGHNARRLLEVLENLGKEE